MDRFSSPSVLQNSRFTLNVESLADRGPGWVAERVVWIGRVGLYPGADGLQALPEGALRVLPDEEEAFGCGAVAGRQAGV